MGHALFWFALAIWLACDFYLIALKRGAVHKGGGERRSKYVMAVVIASGVLIPIFTCPAAKLSFLLPFTPLRYLSVALLLSALSVRITAAAHLGASFSRNVGVSDGARLVTTGIYSKVRHPGYLAELLAFAGIAVAFNHPISSGAAFLMPLAAFLYRIGIEERMLKDGFGEEYSEYARRTCRLIPFIY